MESVLAVASACETRLWSQPLLEASRERVHAGDLKSPLKRLLGDADLWLAHSRKSDQLFTVTTKPAAPSVTYSCSPHCFYSLGTYWWPNNATPDGLPYVRNDGLVNPDTFKYDSIPLSQMLFAVSNLSLAYYLTANRSYAAGAAAFVDAFFFDQETYMDASVGLEHSQAVPGVPNDDAGRGTGIIDAKDIAYALDSACLLPTDEPSWGANRTSQLRSWMGQYWAWMNHSHHSGDEFSSTNNHGTWYDVQALSLALHLADAPSADFFAQHILSRIDEQISSTGELPQETSRTRPLHYTWWALQAFFEHAWMAQSRGVPAFNYTSPSGGSLRKALEWVLPYATGAERFPEPELTPFDAGCFFPILRMAQRVWPEAAPKFEAALRQLPTRRDGLSLLRLAPQPHLASSECEHSQRARHGAIRTAPHDDGLPEAVPDDGPRLCPALASRAHRRRRAELHDRRGHRIPRQRSRAPEAHRGCRRLLCSVRGHERLCLLHVRGRR
jgi:hypothetical protein